MNTHEEHPKEVRFPEGVHAASLTPMKTDLSVDHEALAAHCRWLLDNGCNGVVALGSTGEANSLSVAERTTVIDRLFDAGLPRDRLMVGTGCCALPDTIALTRHAVSRRAGGVLVLPPFYYKRVTDDGVFAVFDRLIQAVGDSNLRIYLYHIPQLTGVAFSAALIERLLVRFPDTVVGIKDSSGSFENMKTVIEAFPGFSVFAGTEKYLLDVLRIGGAGCISATVNVTCGLAAEVNLKWRTRGGDTLQEKLTAARKTIESFPLVPVLKRLMADRTGDSGWLNLRPPHVPLSEDEGAALNDAMGV